jgi:choline dehydrogenase-like flavoprotein
MIRFNAAPAFDFDEWVALHAADPAAFEARRDALRAIEIARGGPLAGSVRAALDGLEAALTDRDAPARAAAARQAAAESAREMSAALEALSRVARHAAGGASAPPAAPGADAPPMP